jgi:hypothetical protein
LSAYGQITNGENPARLGINNANKEKIFSELPTLSDTVVSEVLILREY